MCSVLVYHRYTNASIGGALGITVTVIENGIDDPSSNPGWSFCISICATNLWKGINLSVLPPARGEL